MTRRAAHTIGRRWSVRRWAVVAGLLSVAVAGCGSAGVYADTPIPSASRSATGTTPAPGPTTAAPACGNPLASYAPAAADPLATPAGSSMARIKARGRLIAGVSADTLLLGARNPVTGRIEGFDIAMLQAVSTALFGRPDRIELKVITAAQRIPSLQDGSVDIVARNMTITCDRWTKIAFSSEYYRAGQKVLVPRESTARGMEDLKGRKVCAPTGSTSMDKLRTFTGVVAVGADTHTGCLVLFQQGKVDAITGDDTVLAGLASQDPYAKVVNAPAFTKEPYGLGIALKNADLVRFVNAVLERMRTDGQWTAAYNTWLRAALGPAPAPPEPVYGRAPR